MTRIHSSLSLAPAQVDLGLYAQAEPVYQTVPCFTLFTLLQTLVSFLIFAYGIYVLNSFSSLSFCSLILIPSPHPLGTNLQTKKFRIWFWEFSKPLNLVHWPVPFWHFVPLGLLQGFPSSTILKEQRKRRRRKFHSPFLASVLTWNLPHLFPLFPPFSLLE